MLFMLSGTGNATGTMTNHPKTKLQRRAAITIGILVNFSVHSFANIQALNFSLLKLCALLQYSLVDI